MDRPNTIHAIITEEDIQREVAVGISQLEEMLANETGVRSDELALAA